MAELQSSNSSDRAEPPGKIRTMWHPLLVRMLTVALGSAFKVEQELYVGKMPLRVDIFLIRQQEGQLSEPLAGALSALLPLLNHFTFIEFKAPTDAMERGDFSHLVACAYLWHGQQTESVPHDQISLVVLAPMVSGPLRDDLRALGCEVSAEEPGIYRVTGLPFAAWLMETDVMAEQGQPVLSLVSRLFLNDPGSIMDWLRHTGHEALVEYMLQQIHQFRSGKDFALQHTKSENLVHLEEQMLAKIMEWAPAESRLHGLPPEERLRGLSLEERLAGLTDEQAAQLRKLLELRQDR